MDATSRTIHPKRGLTMDLNCICEGIIEDLRELTKIKSNADHIRSMTNEELAEFLCKVKSDYQWSDHEFPSEEEYGEWVEWLQSEVEE